MPNHKTCSYRALCLILAFVMVFGLTACSDREDDTGSSTAASRPNAPDFGISAPEVSVSDALPANYPDVQDSIEEWKAINDETIGWLVVPGTDISDVVVCKMDPNDYNQYYYRRNARKEEVKLEGAFYADCRIKYDGTVNGLSRNTTIYGHSIEIPDDPDGILFSQIKRYWEEDFARENPYIYFSIDGQDLVWEIFAAFYTNKNYDDKVNDYINPLDTYTNSEIQAWLDRVGERSEYVYDVDVNPSDRFLTLSTCLYHLSNNVYPNDYRWVVMARLVQDGSYNEEASLEKNPSPMSPNTQN